MVQVAYTHSNCSDLWEMFVTENKKYADMPLHFISDKRGELFNDVYLYKDEDPYYYVWARAVMDYKYFIYLQEDFILYDYVDKEKLNEYVDFLDHHDEYSFVRLMRADSFKGKRITDTLYEIESRNKNVFAMQPTIWRAEDYVKLMYEVKEQKWLETPRYRKEIMRMGMKGAYHYDGEKKAGAHHYDNNVYPYVATAIVKGKWNMSEYGYVLGPLLEKYGIDKDERGCV